MTKTRGEFCIAGQSESDENPSLYSVTPSHAHVTRLVQCERLHADCCAMPVVV